MISMIAYDPPSKRVVVFFKDDKLLAKWRCRHNLADMITIKMGSNNHDTSTRSR